MGGETPVGKVDRLGTLFGRAGIDAAAAVDALVVVADVKLIGFVHGEAVHQPAKAGFLDIVLITEILQPAFTRLGTGKTILGMVRQEQLKINLPGANDPIRAWF